ncbi:MAG: hypothetical protein ABI390_02005, partial [Daejeonella sp.]
KCSLLHTFTNLNQILRMPKRLTLLLLVFSLIAYLLMGYTVERSNFGYLISIYSFLFLLYFIILLKPDLLDQKTAIISGLLFRFSLLFFIPNLSDDIYRFLWDGRIQQLGFNPFDYKPSEFLNIYSDAFLQELFPRLNSADYYSVYPQFLQTIFKFTVQLSKQNIFAAAIILKTIILFFEAGSVYLLIQLLKINRLNPKLLFIYLLNPLVIIELTGNIHFEAIMIFGMLFFAFLIQQNKVFAAIPALAIAIQAKLIPFIFIPLLFRKTGFYKTLLFGILSLLLFFVLSPYFWGNMNKLTHFYQSLQLYYGKFEFNGSIYSIFRAIGFWLTGYNTIEFLSKIMFAFTIIGFGFVYNLSKNILGGMFWLLVIYLLFSAIVHPWYLASLIALSPFVKYRFVLILSALVPLTYITYHAVPYEQNYWLIGLEYLISAAFLFYEYRKNKRRIHPANEENILLV